MVRLNKFMVLVAVGAAVGSMGCGGGGGGSDRGKSTAAVSSAVPQLPQGRAEHTATLLPSGDIFIAGGLDASGQPVATTYIVSPSAVRSGPTLSDARVGHSATLLTTGEVLVAGGASDAAISSALASTELFDPVTGTVSSGPALVQPRARHLAFSYSTAAGEQVVLAGGVSANTAAGPQLLSSAELFDVAANTVSALPGALPAAQLDAEAARLDTGSFLVVSGEGANGPAGAAVYDPATKSFSPVTMVASRSGAAVASKGREVLVAGGQSAVGVEDTSEVFDSATKTFAQGKRLTNDRRDARAVILGQEIVLVGGRDGVGAVGDVERVAGASLGQATITAFTALQTPRFSHTATAVSGTKAFVVGGYDAQGNVLASVEAVDLAAKPTTGSGTLTTPRPIGTTTPGITPGTTITPPTTVPPTTTTPPTTGGSGGLGGLLGGLLGGGSGSGSGSSIGSTLLNAALQAAVQTLTSNPGGGFSGFMSGFMQNLMNNLLGSGSGSSGGLGGLLSGLLGGSSGGSSGSSSGGLSGLLSGLLGGSSGGSSGSSSGGLSGILSSLLGSLGGGSSGSSGSSGGLGGLLSGLFGGGSGSSSGSTPPAAPAPAVTGMTPTSGPVGTVVTLTATNLGATVGVRFNGVAGTITSATRAASGVVTIVVPCPAGATTGMVTISTGGVQANAGVFTVQ